VNTFVLFFCVIFVVLFSERRKEQQHQIACHGAIVLKEDAVVWWGARSQWGNGGVRAEEGEQAEGQVCRHGEYMGTCKLTNTVLLDRQMCVCVFNRKENMARLHLHG
jgi:hypothetical protein